jgi:hypothetical protein
MSFIKDYKSFVKEQKKYVNKQSVIIEKELYQDLSESFWTLCLRSEIFDADEKNLIVNHFSSRKVDLLKEEWEWLDKAVGYVKDKGGKILSKFKERIDRVVNGISSFVKSIMTFCKNIFMGMLNGAIKAGKKFATEKKDVVEKKMAEADKKKIDDEMPNLKKVFNYLITGDENKSGIDANVINPELDKKLTSTIATGESNIQQNTLKELSEAEEDVQEGFKFSNERDDIIKHFYEYPLINEGEAVKNVGKSTMKSLGDWFKSFIGDKPDAEVTKGQKLLWWGRLILRVVSGFFGLVVKVAELASEVVTNTSLTLISKVSKWAGGPGPFQFVAIGALVGALVGIVGDVLLLVGATPFPGMEQALELKTWWLTAFGLLSKTDPTFKAIKVILTIAALGFTVYHIYHTIHELKGGHGHDKEHKEGEAKPGSPEVKPGQKPATGTTPAPAA